METSAFCDKEFMPDEAAVAVVLDNSFLCWEEIKSHLVKNYKNISEEWGFSKKGGWSKNIRNGKRSLFYFTPMQGVFRLYFFLSDKAVAAAKDSDMPKEIIALIPKEKGCVCGYGVVLDVKTDIEATAAIKFIEIKDKI